MPRPLGAVFRYAWCGFHALSGLCLASGERTHYEEHYVARVGWLRAAVLGANDGIISTASLIMGVTAASGRAEVLVAGMAGLVAGALSMAAGASAASFAVGAALPMATAALVPEAGISLWVTVLSLIFLAVLGAIGAKAGGAPMARAVVRVTFWGGGSDGTGRHGVWRGGLEGCLLGLKKPAASFERGGLPPPGAKGASPCEYFQKSNANFR